MKIINKVLCLKPRAVDRKARVEELEQQVKQLAEQVALEQREAELRARMKELKAERRRVRPLPVGKFAVWTGLAAIALLVIAKIAGC